MAEVINLATFSLDTAAMVKNLDQLQDVYFDLRKEQKAYTDQSKEVQKQIDGLAKSQKVLTDSAGDNSDAIADNDTKMAGLLKTQKELYKSEQGLATQIGTVKKEINQTTTQLRAYQDAEGKTNSLIDLGNEALGRQIKNKNDARAANIALNNVANQLNPNIEEEAKLLTQLNAKMDANTDFIKENSSETAKQKMNIGNYKDSVVEALREVNLFNGGIGGFISKSQEAGGAGAVLGGAFTAIRVGIIGALKAGLAFIATPIGAVIAALAVSVGLVVGAFKLAKASMQSTEEGTQKLAIVTGAITGVFNGLFKVVKPLGLFFAGVFIKTLENVGAVAEKVANGIASVLEFVGAESAAKGIRNFTNEVKSSSVAAANLAKAEGELTVQQRQARKIQLDYQKDAEKLRQLRDDESKSVAQRIAINNQLGAVLQKQSASELAIANKQLQVSDLRIKAEGKTTEALNARAEAETNISDIKERITSQESEQLSNLNSLRKEASDKQKELNAQAVENALAKSKAEIDLFIAQQGFMKKSMEDELNFNNDLLNKDLANLKLQLKNKKISQTEFDAESLNLKNETLSKNAELVIENASLELDAQLQKNQTILANDKYLSDEQLRIKQEALDAQLLLDFDYQNLLLQNGKINQAEFNAAINQINEENRLSNIAFAEQNKAAEQEKQLIDLDNSKIAQEDNFIAQAEIQKAQNAIKLQQELDAAEKTGADIALIKEKYAQYDKDIEEQKMANKLNLASQTFGNLATIFGEESKAGKAMAVAQTTIDTYQSAISAFKSLSGIPYVGPILGGIAAAAATASGFAAVKKITATKQPTFKKASYARGVIGLRGAGSGTSDDISANLSAGETIMTAQATSMFARELGEMNQKGGGVGLNGASNILNQNEIQSNVNNSQMASMIAEAVAIGAESGTSKGSQKGLIGLSDNRKIMNDAKF